MTADPTTEALEARLLAGTYTRADVERLADSNEALVAERDALAARLREAEEVHERDKDAFAAIILASPNAEVRRIAEAALAASPGGGADWPAASEDERL